MADLEQQMWQMYLDQLTRTVSGVDASQYMPTSGLALANWEVMDVTGLPVSGKPKPKLGATIVAGVQQWADTMPQWSPTYVPGDSLYQSYVDFLGAIQLKGGDPAKEQIASGYAKTFAKANKRLRADLAQVQQEWIKFATAQQSLPAAQQTSQAEWYQQNWASTIAQDQDASAAAQANYQKALQAVGGPDFPTITAARTRASLSTSAGNSLTDPTGVPYPRYDITPSLNQWYVQVLATDGGHPEVDFTIDLSQASEYTGKTSDFFNASIAGQYSGFAWGGSASASYGQAKSREDYSHFMQNMKLRYTAQAVTVFSISNPPWFDAGVVKAFSHQIDPNSAFAKIPMFGPGGLLALRAKQLVVAFKPTITLTGSKSDISSVTEAFNRQGSGTVSVAGLAWSASASASGGSSAYSATVNASGEGDSITIAANTDNPKVIGVIPEKLGDVVQAATGP